MFCSTWSSKESNSCRHQQHWRHNTESLSQFDSASGWLWNPSPKKKARECSLKNMSHIFLCKVNMVNLPQFIPQILNVPMDVWSIFKKSRSFKWWIPYVFLTCFHCLHVQEANVESTSGEPEVKVSVVINIKKTGVDVYYSSTWSTIRTLLHGKIGTLKIDRYWMSLGDGFGFLLCFKGCFRWLWRTLIHYSMWFAVGFK